MKEFISFFEWLEKNHITVSGDLQPSPEESEFYDEMEKQYNNEKNEKAKNENNSLY